MGIKSSLKMNELIKLLHEDEGNVLFCYDDATGKPIVRGYTCVGNPTIGCGRLLTDRHGISREESDYLFSNDLQETILSLQKAYPWFNKLDQVRADVLVSMVFNMGLTNFSEFKKMINAVVTCNWHLAAKELLDSKAARDLPKRYQRLADMMRTGVR